MIEANTLSNQDAFRQLVEPFSRELLVHCYRMLGSLEDAEDTLQETLLRVWHGLAAFEGRSTLRGWLYKIATNLALDTLRSKRHRTMPTQLTNPADPHDPIADASSELIWLEPLPDLLVDSSVTANPEARYEAHEATTLAFLTALQSLPGRQRAVLILRDVLAWHASEVAELLDTSIASINSALQRARATMKERWDRDPFPTPINVDAEVSELLSKYVEAWETADMAALVSLLREDAVLTMPPFPTWFQGRGSIGAFLSERLFRDSPASAFRLVSTRANGAPAFALYQQDSNGAFKATALQVLRIADNKIARIDDFLYFESGEKVFAKFGLPGTI